MKNMKSKLLASVAMLVVSTIMLTSASFAWFTISTAPEIKGITTTVVTNETLEIALDSPYTTATAVDDASKSLNLSGNVYTWGNQVTMDSATDFDKLDKTLRPAKLDGTFKAPKYGADGRIEGNTLSIDLTPTGVTATKHNGASSNGYGSLVDASQSNLVYGYYIDYWMRSNVGGDVILATTGISRDGSGENVGAGSTFTITTDDTNVDEDEEEKVAAANKALAENIRVAFQVITPTANDTTNGKRIFTGNIIEAVTELGENEESATFAMAEAEDEDDKDDVIVTLTPNKAELVRVYVYLDGTALTNDVASVGTLKIAGNLNLQFTIGDMTTMLTEQTTVKTAS